MPVGQDLTVMIRLQACLDQAQAAAQRDGSRRTDTHHLVLGLLHVGIAASVLDKVGVTNQGVQQAITRLFGQGEAARGGSVPGWSDDAAQAIESARSLAEQRGFDYLGTEHLLYVLATDPGSQAARVLQDLGVELDVVVHELERTVSMRRPKVRRRRRRDSEPKCSFCRKTRSGVRKVAGPGVCICADCLRLANESLGDVPA